MALNEASKPETCVRTGYDLKPSMMSSSIRMLGYMLCRKTTTEMIWLAGDVDAKWSRSRARCRYGQRLRRFESETSQRLEEHDPSCFLIVLFHDSRPCACVFVCMYVRLVVMVTTVVMRMQDRPRLSVVLLCCFPLSLFFIPLGLAGLQPRADAPRNWRLRLCSTQPERGAEPDSLCLERQTELLPKKHASLGHAGLDTFVLRSRAIHLLSL
ncbi:hypothetical protein L1887_57333 [Cichorium endivia]|nr:hypothetical protein L1887_57333 [Cichorium endivia]